MKDVLKVLSLAFTQSIIMVVLIMSPIPALNTNRAIAGSSEQKVKTESSCADEKEKGQPGIYKAGCDFNKDLAKTDLKDHYPEGVVGIVEQLVGAVFALVGITAFYTPYPTSLVDCPTHLGAKVTFPIISAGSLAYLLGEVAANDEFRKGSKIAVDKNFEAKKDESYDRSIKDKDERNKARDEAVEKAKDNSKQIAAYEALETIYSHQKEGLSKKIMLASAAEAAFLTAEGIELSDLTFHISSNEKSLIAVKENEVSLISSLKTIITSLSTPCPDLPITVGTYITALASQNFKNFSVGTSDAQLSVARSEKQILKVSSFLTTPIEGINGLTAGEHKEEIAEQQSKAAVNESKKTADKALRAAEISAIELAAGRCAQGLAVSTVYSALGPQIPLLIENVAAIETNRAAPLLCGGVDAIFLPDYDVDRSFLSALGVKTDNLEPLADTPAGGFIKAKNRMFYVENILNNFYHRLLKDKLQKVKFESPKQELASYAAASEYADFLTKEALNKLKHTDIEKEFDKQFPGVNKSNVLDNFDNVLADIKNSFIKSAEAVEFMDLLMFGVKIGILYYFMANTIRNNAFPKPKNRAITWGIMSVVNGAIIAFDSKAKKEASDRLSTVREEKERFIASTGVKTGLVSPTNSIGGELNINQGKLAASSASEPNIMACAVPNGNTYAPAVCPTKLQPNTLSVPLDQAKFIAKNRIIGSTAGLVTGVTKSAAQGEHYSDPKVFGAKIETLNQNKAALRSKVADLRKKFDELPSSKGKDGKAPKRTSLADTNLRFKKLYTGNPSKTGITEAQASQLSSLKVPDIEKLKKGDKGKVTKSGLQVPKFNLPNSKKSDFDFDVGDSGKAVKIEDSDKVEKGEEDLANFQLDGEEINENENVDIFKLISNRYLLSYPKLLDEK